MDPRERQRAVVFFKMMESIVSAVAYKVQYCDVYSWNWLARGAQYLTLMVKVIHFEKYLC